ncbi:MAG: ribbon-helix-helix protein, CopG family [Spirochaetota bacterium]
MFSVRLDPEIAERLQRLAKETGRSKSYYVKQAIENYLEDREDYLLALSVLEKNEPRKFITEVRRELGLEDRTYPNS